MKMHLMFGAMVIMVLAPLLLLAQEVVPVIQPVSDLDFIGQLISFFTNIKGMASAAITLGAIQLIIAFLKTGLVNKVFSKLTAELKYILVTFLTFVVGYITTVATGVPSSQALLGILAMPLFQEILYKIYKLFQKK